MLQNDLFQGTSSPPSESLGPIGGTAKLSELPFSLRPENHSSQQLNWTKYDHDFDMKKHIY